MTDSDSTLKRRADGFLERGHQVTRLEAFVDAAFAFALSLLVIATGESGDVGDLLAKLCEIPGLLCSFVLLAMFWYAHNKWSRRYGLDDTGSIVLSLVLVFLVLIYVYPLRMMFGSLFHWLSHLLLPPDQVPSFRFAINNLRDVVTLFIIYGVAWSSLGFVISLLYRRAGKLHEQLDLDIEERALTAGEAAGWMCAPLVGAASIAIATLWLFWIPPAWAIGAPGFVYFAMFITGSVSKRVTDRKRRELMAEAA